MAKYRMTKMKGGEEWDDIQNSVYRVGLTGIGLVIVAITIIMVLYYTHSV